jgi:acyl-CoA dehydrogenase
LTFIDSQKDIERFAAQDLRRSLERAPETFPFRLFAQAELAGYALPCEFGGQGASALHLFQAARTIVRESACLGVVVGWLAHQQMARHFIVAHGNKQQKERWLPELASGARLGAMAMSELGAAAHPKYLKTTAMRCDGGYVLNGEKAYTTNGPLAGLYAVLAVSDEREGRKYYSVFLVPRETNGLTLTNAGHVDFFRPTTHGGIKLENCFVPDDALLGEAGTAYEKMARPLRASEDAYGIATRLGAIEAQMLALVQAQQDDVYGEDFLASLGRLALLISAGEQLGASAVQAVGQNTDAVPFITAWRFLASEAARLTDAMAQKLMGDRPAALAQLQEELKKAQDVARRARLERERQEAHRWLDTHLRKKPEH